MQEFIATIQNIISDSGFAGIVQNWVFLAMIVVACVLLYLAIVHEFEPLLLLPIAFGMLLANLPGSEIIHMEYFIAPADAADPSIYPLFGEVLHKGGLADMLYLGVKLGIYPPLIFMGIGTMTDFGPLISNPKSLLLGAAAQLGIFITFIGARFLGFTGAQAASIGIIGGADGPTAIFVSSQLLGPDMVFYFLAGSPAVLLGLIGWFCRLSGWQRGAKWLAWAGLASHLVWLAVCAMAGLPGGSLAFIGLGLGLWLCLGLLWREYRKPKDEN